MATPARRTAEARTAFTASLTSVGSNLSADLESRAKIIHENARNLSKQEAELAKNTKLLAKENEQMERTLERTRRDLDALGDLQGSAEGIERDLAMLESMLEEIEGVEEDDEPARKSDPGEANRSESLGDGHHATD